METTIMGCIGLRILGFRDQGFYWGYMGIMEKKMETTIMGCIGFRVSGLGFRVWGLGFGV